MTQIKNNINTYADLTAYNADLNKEFPNVSYIEELEEVKYGSNILVAKYNVTTTGSATKLLNSTTGISSMTIDGVEQQSVVASYTFSTTGEHIVKYKLVDQTTIVERAFNQCTNLINIEIPISVTTVDNNAFNGSGLTSVTIPDNVTNIGYNTFRQCSSLASVVIGNGVTSIGSMAFYTCSSLASVVIGNGVTSIDNQAFSTNYNLTSFTIYATTPPTLGSNVFASTTCPIYVPAESVNAYKTAANWSTYASRIQAIPNS